MKKTILTVLVLAAVSVIAHFAMNFAAKASYEVASTSAGSACDPGGTNGGGGSGE